MTGPSVTPDAFPHGTEDSTAERDFLLHGNATWIKHADGTLTHLPWQPRVLPDPAPPTPPWVWAVIIGTGLLFGAGVTYWWLNR